MAIVFVHFIVLLSFLNFASSASIDFGIAGTGAMGNALGECLLKNDYSVIGWNRTPSKTKILEDAGASTAKDIVELFQKTDTVIMTVVGDTDMKTANELLEQVGEGLKGKTVIQWTTHDPLAAEAQAKLVEGYGGTWIGGAMMVMPVEVCDPTGLYFLSGASQEIFDGLSTKLKSLGNVEYLGESPGFGALYDIAVLTPFFFGFAGHMAAMALIKAAGGDLGVYLQKALFIVDRLLPAYNKISTSNVQGSNYLDPNALLLPVHSAVPVWEMHLNYYKAMNVDFPVLEGFVRQYVDLTEKVDDIGPYDISIMTRFMDKSVDAAAIKSEL